MPDSRIGVMIGPARDAVRRAGEVAIGSHAMTGVDRSGLFAGRYRIVAELGRGGMGVVYPGRRHPAEAPGRPEVPLRRSVGPPGGARPVPARGPGGGRARQPARLHGVRGRRARGPRVHRDGVHRGPQPQRADRPGPAHAGRGPDLLAPDRRRPGGGPRQASRSPRHQAGQHHAGRRPAGEDHRLRPRAGRGLRRDDENRRRRWARSPTCRPSRRRASRPISAPTSGRSAA